MVGKRLTLAWVVLVRSTTANTAECLSSRNAFHPRAVLSQNHRSTSLRSNHHQTGKKRSPPPSIPQRLIAGGVGRCLGQILLYPVDALRTLAQTRDAKTLSDLGTKSLVSGCVTTSSFALFAGAVQFSVFGATRDACGALGASCLSAMASCVVSIPQEVIKQRLVTGIYPGFRSAVATIAKTEGISGFYSAWRPTMARNVPFVIICFTTHDFLGKHVSSRKGRRGEGAGLTVSENLCVGVLSAIVGCVCTQPMDVVKTRMMTQAASAAVPYASSLDCVKQMLKTEPTKLWSGLVQRSCYMGPLWALQFAINGRMIKMLQDRNEGRLHPRE